MKKFLSTWITLGLFAVLLAYLLIAKPKTKEEREEAERTVVQADRDAIDRIQIQNPRGRFVLEKTGESWTITEPRELPAEESAVSPMLNTLSSLHASDKVWEAPTDAERERAGLKEPATVVTFRAAGKERTLEIGGAFPQNDTVYVSARGTPAVFTVRRWNLDAFGKGLDELRRKRLFAFDRDEVRSIAIERSGRAMLSMTRSDATAPWIATVPFAGRGDRGKANGLLTRIEGLSAKRFLDQAVPASGGGGSAAPGGTAKEAVRATITLGLADGTTRILAVGPKSAPRGGVTEVEYRDAATGTRIVADASLEEDLAADADEWRDSNLFDFVADEATSLELTVDGSTVAVSRGEGAAWKTTAAPENVVSAEASAFLRQAKLLTSKERGPEVPPGSHAEKRYGLSAPALRATWKVGDRTMELVVGGATQGAGGPPAGGSATGSGATGNPGAGGGRWMRTGESKNVHLVALDILAAARALKDAAVKAPPATATSAGTADVATEGG